jgi:predicted transport protein
MDHHHLFPGPLADVYDALRARLCELGPDVVEQFARTEVSYGAARKFAWLGT